MKSRRVRFGCEGRDEVFAIEVNVVGRPGLGDAPCLSREQHNRYRELESAHGGVVPLSPEEYDALEEGDPGRLAELASSPESNLRPLLVGA